MIDAVVIGSGPNGLSAAIVLAQAGCKVVVFEANATIGGGARSAELTLPGFMHDTCSAVHPFAIASPFWRTLPLARHGLEWIEPPAMLAHPFDDGSAALDRVVARGDRRPRWDRMRTRTVQTDRQGRQRLAAARTRGARSVRHLHGTRLRSRGSDLAALRSAERLAARAFSGERTRALFAGIAAHGMLPLDRPLTAGVGLDAGRDVPRRRLADSARRRPEHHDRAGRTPAVARRRGGRRIEGDRARRASGGEGRSVRSVAEAAARDRRAPVAAALPSEARALPLRHGRLQGGLGAFGADSLDGRGMPAGRDAASWRHARRDRALGGRGLDRGDERSSVRAAQPADAVRPVARAGRQARRVGATATCRADRPPTCWTASSGRSSASRRAFATACWRDRSSTPATSRPHNANFVGGDIAAGVTDLRQFFTRPTWRTYSTPVKGLYLCSASTPPGRGRARDVRILRGDARAQGSVRRRQRLLCWSARPACLAFFSWGSAGLQACAQQILVSLFRQA